MDRLVIQVHRAGEWRNVTTIRVEPAVERDRARVRGAAYAQATRELAGWAGSEQFVGDRMRIAMPGARGAMVEARL